MIEQQKIFATYLGCKLYITAQKLELDREVILDAYWLRVLQERPGIFAQLILKPLSEISEEHAAEFARTQRYVSDQPDTYAKVGKEIIKNVLLKGSKWCISYQGADYLRRHGYDCGFENIPSLIEAGFAKTGTV